MPLIRSCLVCCLLCAAVCPAAAQSPGADPTWSGSVAAGLAVTGGNTETATTNFTFDVQSPQAARNVMKAEGLNIRSSGDGDSIVDRTSLSIRDEYGLHDRAYVFAQVQYLRDLFKNIEYLTAPTLGLGVNLAENEQTNISLDASVGAVMEKNTGLPSSTSGALTVRENATHAISPTATFTQSFNALWKTADFEDALYTFRVGLAATVTTWIQIKVEFLDTFKTQPPSEDVLRNDTALVTSFGFKF